jgi:hypothetical protein
MVKAGWFLSSCLFFVMFECLPGPRLKDAKKGASPRCLQVVARTRENGKGGVMFRQQRRALMHAQDSQNAKAHRIFDGLFLSTVMTGKIRR